MSELDTPVTPRGSGRVRVALTIAYDGTNFAGWAIQPGQRTVAGELLRGLEKICRTDSFGLTVAGRTDSGVHATGQVAHIDIDQLAFDRLPGRGDHEPEVALVRRLGGVLPSDVVVRSAQRVSSDFDARFSAEWRSYRYRLSDTPATRNPLTRTSVHWLRKGPVDTRAMHSAAQLLLGEHDWLGYCKPREGASTVRTLHEFTWSRDDEGLAVAYVRADAFCHHMVRSLVGATVAVGLGQRDTTWPRAVLDAQRRDSAVQIIAGEGLTLENVGYPPPERFATQATATRRFRTL